MLSKKAIDLIIQFEVGGRAYYDKKLQSPIWAGGESGITIGMGYDCGFVSEKQFFQDWGNMLTPNFLEPLRKTIGLKGIQAKQMQQLQKIRGDQDFIFPGWKSGTGLSDGAMLVLMENHLLELFLGSGKI